jgi:protein-disulfide isomerase
MNAAAARVTVVILGLGLGLGACVTRGEVEELRQNQEKILAKLDAISKGPTTPMPLPPRGPDPAKTYAVPVDDSPVRGPADAWVTVIEISDFECPYCKAAAATVKQVEQKYGNDLRVVFKHNPLPFHRRAKAAAMAAACANEQGKFWKMHDVLFENQRALEDADLERYATEAGLDVGRFKACYATGKYKERIEAEQTLIAKFGSRGTPAFFINGRHLVGAQELSAFQGLIDEELKKAKDSGIAKKDYFVKQVIEKGEKPLY